MVKVSEQTGVVPESLVVRSRKNRGSFPWQLWVVAQFEISEIIDKIDNSQLFGAGGIE